MISRMNEIEKLWGGMSNAKKSLKGGVVVPTSLHLI